MPCLQSKGQVVRGRQGLDLEGSRDPTGSGRAVGPTSHFITKRGMARLAAERLPLAVVGEGLEWVRPEGREGEWRSGGPRVSGQSTIGWRCG